MSGRKKMPDVTPTEMAWLRKRAGEGDPKCQEAVMRFQRWQDAQPGSKGARHTRKAFERVARQALRSMPRL